MHHSELIIIYEDNHFIAVNKPSGVLVQPDNKGSASLEELVKELIKERDNKPGAVFLGVCHRLDRPVSGVVLFAKTSKALVRINEMFRDKEVKKTYWAVVEHKPDPPEAHLTHWLKKDEKQNVSKAYPKEIPGSQKCDLEYKWTGSSDRYFLLEVNPHTGRHHQIRVQLAKIGCSIKGDIKYGAKRTNPDGRIHLHARRLSFLHPVKKETVVITAPVPDEIIWKVFAGIN